MEKWKMFYYGDRCLGGYTICGTFDGEEQATKEMLSIGYGIGIEDIDVKIEEKGNA